MMWFWLAPILIIIFIAGMGSLIAYICRVEGFGFFVIISISVVLGLFAFIVSYAGIKTPMEQGRFDNACHARSGIVSEDGLCFVNNSVVELDGRWIRPS